MKKIIFLMFFAIIGWQQVAAQSFTFGGLDYYVSSPTTVAVGLQNSLATGSIIIPSQVTYNNGTYSVNYIVSDAFYGCAGLTSVIIPNSVTSIDEGAFADCYSLTSVTIPNSVTTICARTFASCTSLTSISIPNSVTSIEKYAFAYCSSLTSFTFPNSVTSIDAAVFSNCSSLTSVTIPNSITSIGAFAFDYCASLTSLTIPNSVTSIGAVSFNHTGLTSITIPNSVTSIGNSAFNGCNDLTSVTVNWSTPLAIGNTVFFGVNTPTVVLNVPNGTASIYDAAAVWTDFMINDALSVTSFSSTNAFNLMAYPNPSNNVFNFKMNGANDETVSLLVFDMTGRQIENKVVNANDFKNIALGQNYSNGVYNVVVSQGRKTKTVRLVKG